MWQTCSLKSTSIILIWTSCCLPSAYKFGLFTWYTFWKSFRLYCLNWFSCWSSWHRSDSLRWSSSSSWRLSVVSGTVVWLLVYGVSWETKSIEENSCCRLSLFPLDCCRWHLNIFILRGLLSFGLSLTGILILLDDYRFRNFCCLALFTMSLPKKWLVFKFA